MRIAAVAYALAGAGLAAQVSAAPLRVVYLENNTPSNVEGIAQLSRPNGDAPTRLFPVESMAGAPDREHAHRRPGCGLRGKQLSWMNAIRKALGLPVVETYNESFIRSHHHHHHAHKNNKNNTTEDGDENERMHKGTIQIIPFLGSSSKPTIINVEDSTTRGGDELKIVTTSQMDHLAPAKQWEEENFLRRVHFSLMALGPWEGRAVAFVLGCGIGVLLRMVWVLAVVFYRTVRGGSSNEVEYEAIVYDANADAEEIFVAPPNYTAQAEEIQRDEEKKALQAAGF